ncbi:MAG: hypothetical protein AABY88_01855 [Pseudomonadota bacterium]
MSRMAIMFAFGIVAIPANAQSLTAETALTTYTERMATRPNCKRARAANEITVCGRRDADKYRAPLIVYQKGDPHAEGLWGERARLQHQTTPCQDNSVFLVGCGSVGVSVSTRLDGTGPKLRKLAD